MYPTVQLRVAKLSCSIVLACATIAPAIAQERTREPGHILKPEQAGILLSEMRVGLEQPDKTLDFMGLNDGDTVVDLGCGNGFYTLRLAERVAPSGKVLAQDIQQGMHDQLSKRAKEAGAKNIELILGTETDPKLPEGVADWMLLVDVYHEFSDPEAMLAGIKKALKPDGKIALLEYRAEQTDDVMPAFIPRDHKMTIEEVMSEWTAEGFTLVERREFLPAQHLFVFQAARGDAQPIAWDLASSIYPIDVDGVVNPSTFGNFVHFSGQPALEGFKNYADMGVDTVLNLRMQAEVDSLDFDQAALIKEVGMAYEHVGIRGEPTEEQLDKIFSVIEENEKTGKSILLQCGSSNRVGYVWSMYRATRNGLSLEDAIAEGKAAGMRASSLDKLAREYISSQD